MNYQCVGNVIVQGSRVIVDGDILPPVPSPGYNTTVIDGKVYIDGYEFKDGKWKKTLRALWHKWF